jgi:hypothetical protein
MILMTNLEMDLYNKMKLNVKKSKYIHFLALIKDIIAIFIEHVSNDLKSSNPKYSAEVFSKTKKDYGSKDYRKKGKKTN